MPVVRLSVACFSVLGTLRWRTDLVDLGRLAKLLLGLVVRHLGWLVSVVEVLVVD